MTEANQTSRRWARYAAEFGVVFLGVWLSLLAEGWRQSRLDRRTEQAALEGMAQELTADVEDMERNLARARRGLEAATWLLSQRARVPPADSVAPRLTALGSCSFPFLGSSQYSTLKSAGDLNLIRNRELRSQIAATYELRTFLEWLHERDCLESSGVLEVLAPLVTLTIHVPIPGGPNEWAADVLAADDVAAVYADPAALNRIAKLASHRQFVIDWIQREIDKTQALRAAILAALSGF